MFNSDVWRGIFKFLSGAFIVKAVMLLYLNYYSIPAPIPGTGIVESPQISGLLWIVPAILFALVFYLGFLRKVKA